MFPNQISRPVLSCVMVAVAALATGLLGFPLKLLAGFLLVVVLPGVVLLQLIDAKGLATARAIALVPALSFAVVIGCGIILHVFNAMHQLGWIISLSAMILCGNAWDAMQRPHQVNDPNAAPLQSAERLSVVAIDRTSALMFAAALGVVALTLTLTTYRAANHREFEVSEFWMSPSRSTPSEYVLGVQNLTGTPLTYSVELNVGGQPHSRWTDVALRPGQSWSATFQAPPIGGNDRARADLFIQSEPARVHRSVWLAPRQPMDRSTGGAIVQPQP
jgi:hypothetical protein